MPVPPTYRDVYTRWRAAPEAFWAEAAEAALIYDSPVTETVRTFTSRELRDEVARFAGALAGRGVTRGDRVIIYVPMVPETVIAMLACARIGAIHSVVFGGFASPELATSRRSDIRSPLTAHRRSPLTAAHGTIGTRPACSGSIRTTNSPLLKSFT